MAKSLIAKSNPSVIKWARKSAGYTTQQVAHHLKTSDATIETWETTEGSISLAQLRKLANYYKRPLATFYLPEPPKGFQPLRDFRHLPNDVSRPFSPQLRHAISLAEYRQATYKEELIPIRSKPLPWIGKHSISDDPNDVAKTLRRRLAIPITKQLHWESEYEAAHAWIDATESMGVLVTHAEGINIDEMRGFCLYDTTAPLICLNSKDHPHPRIFSLIHELTHLAIAAPGVSSHNTPATPRSDTQIIEVFCNSVASRVLVPQTDFANRTIGRRNEYDIRKLTQTLSKLYRVSPEVIARRLLDNNKITPNFYRSLRKDFSSAPTKNDGFLIYPRKVVRYNGRKYSKAVLSAFYADRINASDVSTYLNAKLNNLPAIELEVFGKTSGYGESKPN